MDDIASVASDASDVTHISDSTEEAPAVQQRLYTLWVPPTDVDYFGQKADLLDHLQGLVGPHGYAISKKRSTNYQSGRRCGQLNRIWIQCDRGSKPQASKATKRMRTSSHREGCPFELIFRRTPTPEHEWKWTLRIIEGRHCHGEHAAVAHPSQRKLQVTQEIKEKILHQSRSGSTPAEILASLRLSNPDLILTNRDVYNLKFYERCKALGNLTPTQALVKELHEQDDWTYAMTQNEDNDAIERLFFAHETSIGLLKENPEVLIMDCTYKTNRFKMPLSIMVGHTSIGTTFYVSFRFLSGEMEGDFRWLLQQIKALYLERNLPDPYVIITDRDLGLINAITAEYPAVGLNLCTWHVQHDLTKVKKSFLTDEAFKTMQDEFTALIGSYTEEIYEQNWRVFQEKYKEEYPEVVDYVKKTWIDPWHRQLVTCFTKQRMHFGTTTTSRAESAHTALKSCLNCSTGDLKTVCDAIALLINQQHKNFEADLAYARANFPYKLRHPIYRELTAHITPHALWKIEEQRQLYLNSLKPEGKALTNCTGGFNSIYKMPCAHDIKGLIERSPHSAIRLDDVHPHWRFTKPPISRSMQQASQNINSTSTSTIDPRLLVNEPAIVRGKGRPMDSQNKRAKTHENSTRRDPSSFETINKAIATARRGGPRGRGRGGRGRGSGNKPLPSSAPAALPSAAPKLGGKRGSTAKSKRGGDTAGDTGAGGQERSIPASFLGEWQA